jgi:ribosomal protein S18 acetylase RimI-like enzyme
LSDLQGFLPESLRESVVLRELECSDVDRVVGYFESLGEDTRGFFHPHPFDREHAEKICRDDEPGSFRVVAESDGRIVGYAWFSPWSKSPYSTVGIGISDDFQGQRLGGALMDALTAEAKKRNVPGLKLTVYKNNERGIRLYASRGYRIVGEDGAQHVMDLVLDETSS